MPRIIQIPGRSGFYLSVVVPRGPLRKIMGTCDVVKKIGKTKEEAIKNALKAEEEIYSKFKLKLTNIDSSSQNNQDILSDEDEKIEKDLEEAGYSKEAINALISYDKESCKKPDNKIVSQEIQPSFPCIANNSINSKFEQFKNDSNYLSEPLESELKNDLDHFSNDAVQLLKFHGSYQQDDREHRKKGGTGKDWQMMLRLRNPGGFVPGPLFVALDDLSNYLGNGTLRATTRQCFQIHGIRKDHIKEVIGTIVRSMGSTLAACGDINRNVMAPAAPYSHGAYPAARKLADEIADLLSPKAAEKTYLDLWVNGEQKYSIKSTKNVQKGRTEQYKKGIYSGDEKEPLYGSTYMPRKFKCAVTVPGDNSVDLLTHDIGLVVFINQNGKLQGCNVYVGGGMGRTHNLEATFARTADPIGYVKAENIHNLVQSVLALQRDYGDRKTRRHARLKYVVHDMGVEWLIKQLKTKYFDGDISNMKLETSPEMKDYLGWHRQSKDLWFVGVPILSGRLNGKIKHGLRNIVDKYKLDIRLTPNQDLLLCNIGNYQKTSICKDLELIGIIRPESPKRLERHALACPALPLCGLAMTEAERTLPSILNRIEKLLNKHGIDKSILIRITGCPNGCARPYMAELALVGSGLDQYQLWLGGTPDLQTLAKPYLQKMSIDKLESIIEPLIVSWKKSGKNMSFGKYVQILKDEKVHKLLKVAELAP